MQKQFLDGFGAGRVEGKDGRVYEVFGDSLGKRLWINADDGSAIARFNTQTGVDVHNTVTDQMQGLPECLWCTHGKPDYRTWQGFISAVQEHFGISVPINSIDVGLLGR